MSNSANPKNTGPVAIWQESHSVRFGVIDRSDRLTLDAVFQFFQEAAISHAENLGVGRDDMAQTGQVWILSRMSVQIDRRPAYGEAITVRTWPRGGEKLLALRDFDIRDAANVPVVRARSGWIILEKDKRRPLRPDSVLGTLPLNKDLDALPSGADGLAERSNLKKNADRKALYTDVDYNGHVNNVKYIQWIEDILSSQQLEKAGQIRLDINYLTEILPNENIAIWSSPFTDDNKNGAAAPATTSFAIEGRKDGGTPAFRAEVRLWENAAQSAPVKYSKKIGSPFLRFFSNLSRNKMFMKALAAALLLSIALNVLLLCFTCSRSTEFARLRVIESEWLATEGARIEAERLAAEEAARLEEEAARLEAERFEAERLAAEEAARRAAEEEAARLAAEEARRRTTGSTQSRPASQQPTYTSETSATNAFVGVWATNNQSVIFRFRDNGNVEVLKYTIVDQVVDVRFRTNRGVTGGGFYDLTNPEDFTSDYTGTGTYTVNKDEVTFKLDIKNDQGTTRAINLKTRFFFMNSNSTLRLANGVSRKFIINRQTRETIDNKDIVTTFNRQ